jgi:hypothetical protein
MNNDELQDGCIENVPIQHDGIVPKDDLVHTFMYRKCISKKKIEELAVQALLKYEFGCSKKKAQRVLKEEQRTMGKFFRSPAA